MEGGVGAEGLVDVVDELFGGVSEACAHGFEESPEQFNGDALFLSHQLDEVGAADGEEVCFFLDDHCSAARKFVDDRHFSEVVTFTEGRDAFPFAEHCELTFKGHVENLTCLFFFDDTFASVECFKVGDVHEFDELLVTHVLEEGDERNILERGIEAVDSMVMKKAQALKRALKI